MLPSRHVIVSLVLGGGIWVFTQSFIAGLLCLFSGILIDVDHLIDYVINSGLKGFSVEEFYWTCLKLPQQKEQSKFKKVYLIFHAWEIAILLWAGCLLFKSIYFLAIALGYTAHILMDNAVHVFHPFSYFIIYRLRKDFRTSRLFRS